MDVLFQCPCHAGREMGADCLRLKIVGISDTVLYRTVILMEDPADPVNKLTGRRKTYGVLPCRECDPPAPGTIPPMRNARLLAVAAWNRRTPAPALEEKKDG